MSWVVLVLAAVLFFLSIWIVVPAPTMFLLTFAVGAPEVSPILLVPAIVTAVLAWRGTGRVRRAAFVLAVSASVLFAVPLARYPWGVAPLSLDTLLAGVDLGQSRLNRGVPFAAPEGVQLTMDIYRPITDGPHPAIVQIHGGAWQRGAPGNDAAFAARLASRGHVVFAIDYRHAPAWKWPAQLDDVQTALAWIREHGAEYGADPSRLALFGRSAGSQLAMVAGLQDPGVSAVISYYGPVNLTNGWREPPRPDPIGSRDVLEAMLGGTPDQMPERYQHASPISYVSAKAPRTLLIYGSRDHIVQPKYGRNLHAALRAAGASSELIEIPWGDHAFDALPGGLSGQVALFYTERFLAEIFGR
ncbi:MAG: alpha/beta hydrolase fold domain-containing protein [Vicinamibacterales bacterium]